MKINIPMRMTNPIRCSDLSQHIPARKQPSISCHALKPGQSVYPNQAQQQSPSLPPIPSRAQQHSPMPSPAPAPSAAPSQQRSPMPSPSPTPVPSAVPTPPLPADVMLLQKGQKINVTGKNGAPLQKLVLGVGWQLKNPACELDISAFMLDENSRIIGEEWFVFYGQPVSPDGSIRFSDASGADRESVSVDLQRVSPSVQRIALVVTINEALQRHLNFSMVQDVYVRILDAESGAETARFLLTDYYSNVTAMVVGELYRYKGVWKLNAVGDGVAKDLAGLCAMYGVEVEGG